MPDPLLLFHYDLKHAMWSEEYMQRTTSTLSSWGYNGILLEIEDKYRFAEYPSFAHADALNREEMKATASQLRAAGMEVIPLLQTLGHAEYILRNEEFAALRESPEHRCQFDPDSDKSQEFLKALIDEIIDAVEPERYFHMGGDETWNLGKSEKCKPIVEKIGTGGLYMKHMLPLFAHIHSRGLRPIIWPDIVLTHPEVIDQIPPYVALMDWDYWTAGERWPIMHIWGKGALSWEQYKAEDLPEFREHLERFAVDDQTREDGSFRSFYCMDALRDKGFDVFLAPATRSHGDNLAFPRYPVHDPNCFYAARKGMHEGLGCCVTSWAVRHSHPELNLTSAFAATHALRQDAAFSPQSFAEAYTEERYGQAMASFARLQEAASQVVQWSSSHTVRIGTLAENKAAIEEWLKAVDGAEGGRDAEAASIGDMKAQYQEGLSIVEDLRAQTKQNANDFDFWQNGLEYLVFCADFGLAVLGESLVEQRAAMLMRLQCLRKQTERLFATTYPPHSAVEEATRRFGMHEQILLDALPE